jgi:hypothetical protein
LPGLLKKRPEIYIQPPAPLFPETTCPYLLLLEDGRGLSELPPKNWTGGEGALRPTASHPKTGPVKMLFFENLTSEVVQ